MRGMLSCLSGFSVVGLRQARGVANGAVYVCSDVLVLCSRDG